MRFYALERVLMSKNSIKLECMGLRLEQDSHWNNRIRPQQEEIYICSQNLCWEMRIGPSIQNPTCSTNHCLSTRNGEFLGNRSDQPWNG